MVNKTILAATLILLFCRMALAQSLPANCEGVRFGEPYRVHPSAVNQTEVFIEHSPAEPSVLWVSCNTLNFIPFFISEGIYVTRDGGATWQGSDTCTGSPLAFHGGDPGIAIGTSGDFVLTRMGRAPFTGLYAHRSSDYGQTWSAQTAISTDDLERASLVTNTVAGTTAYGRIHAGWVKFAWPFPVMTAYTDDDGRTWSQPRQLNNPALRCAGGDLAIGPEGEVLVCWAGVTDISPFKEIQVGFASSANGGADWTVLENAFPISGINGTLPEKNNIRVNGLPAIAADVSDGPRRGWLYIVTGQKGLAPAGSDPDIILNRSADGGKTWSPGIRVNQDPLNNGRIQYFPSVHVDRQGGVNILFYDDRLTAGDSANVYLARSVDGGETFREYRISSRPFRPKSIGGLGQGYQGDNIDLTSTDTHLWPVWMDNSTGVYQVWTVPVSFSSLGAAEKETREEIRVEAFPNPSRGLVNFRIRVPGRMPFRVELFTMLGERLAVAADGWLPAGETRISWQDDRVARPNPVVWYRVTLGGTVKTGTLVLLNQELPIR